MAVNKVKQAQETYGLSQIVIAVGLIVILAIRPSGLFGSHEPPFLVGGRADNDQRGA